MIELQVFDSADALAGAAAALFLSRLESNCALSVAVSGGSTPGPAYRKIAGLAIDWSDVNVWWVDERFVPTTDEASNERLVREAWLNQVSIPSEQIHPMYREGDPNAAAEVYEAIWRRELGDGGVDLAFMGIGGDGHTASLFPGDQESLESPRLVVPTLSPAGVAQRISLTRAALSRCEELVFLATGKEKAPYVTSIRAGKGDWPSCQIARAAKKVTLLVDHAAAGD